MYMYENGSACIVPYSPAHLQAEVDEWKVIRGTQGDGPLSCMPCMATCVNTSLSVLLSFNTS